MKSLKTFCILLLISATFTYASCDGSTANHSGVQKATVKVQTGSDGLTAEQVNIKDRLLRDNEVGSIKHLYIVSAYTGDVLQYSTVRGKVTSGGKRLSPRTVNGYTPSSYGVTNTVNLNGHDYVTDEVLDDNGAYGESGNYLFWFDAQGNYMQYYPSGGTYLQISDRPLRIKKSTMSLELNDAPRVATVANDADKQLTPPTEKK